MIPPKITREMISDYRKLLSGSIWTVWLTVLLVRSVSRDETASVWHVIKLIILIIFCAGWWIPWYRHIRKRERTLNDDITREAYELVTLLHDHKVYADSDIDWAAVAAMAKKIADEENKSEPYTPRA